MCLTFDLNAFFMVAFFLLKKKMNICVFIFFGILIFPFVQMPLEMYHRRHMTRIEFYNYSVMCQKHANSAISVDFVGIKRSSDLHSF